MLPSSDLFTVDSFPLSVVNTNLDFKQKIKCSIINFLLRRERNFIDPKLIDDFSIIVAAFFLSLST
jgi:hypothetical protein